jgi:outer membrane protein TolC
MRQVATVLTIYWFVGCSVALAHEGGGAALRALELHECIQLAKARQPRLAAQRTDLALAENGKRALDSYKLVGLLDAEIPIRRRQAELGLAAASAGLDQAEREMIYAVTRTYITVQYAREQETLARGVVERLGAIHQAAATQLKAGARDITDADVNRTKVYWRLAETKRIQATQSVKLALSALREAIGLDSDAALEVRSGPLSSPTVYPREKEIVAWTVARRGELIRASIFADVVCLEAEAQALSLHLRKETFAAGTDIHATLVPQGVQNSQYRPGAIAPEMPVILYGPRSERVKNAQLYHARALSLVEVVRKLITLEAEEAFNVWEEAASQVSAAREAADAADLLADSLTKDFTAQLRVRIDEVVNARVLAAQTRAQHNEYLFKQIIALAGLARVTAGGFQSELAECSAVK